MRITFLGTGTSQGVPVIACQCAVCCSDDSRDKRLRTSILVEDGEFTIVVDTGPDFRYQMLRQNVRHLDAVLITHSHKDHIAGMDDVRAFNFQQQAPIPVYSSPETQDALRREFYYAFGERKYPGVPRLQLETIVAGEPFLIGTQRILPFEVMHYKMQVMGFRIGDFAYITDAKTVSDASRSLLEGVRTLVVNALQEEPHISHFTRDEAIAFARGIQAEKTFLTHISHRFGKHQDIQNGLPEGFFVAFDGLAIEIN